MEGAANGGPRAPFSICALPWDTELLEAVLPWSAQGIRPTLPFCHPTAFLPSLPLCRNTSLLVSSAPFISPPSFLQLKLQKDHPQPLDIKSAAHSPAAPRALICFTFVHIAYTHLT